MTLKAVLSYNASLLLLCTMTFSCKKNEAQSIGTIERIDPSFNELVSENATMQIISEGYEWSEGTIWVDADKMLLFSDVPKNTVYKWSQEKGTEVYLTPSGYTGAEPSQSKEPGSNGLTLNKEGQLVLCQHGDRRVAKMNAPLHDPKPDYITIVDSYQGKKLNSPNDLVYRSNGDLFFTDPPYGLPLQNNDPTKELPFNGVYKVSADGNIQLLVDSLTRPNGIAFTPDEKTLIVANSDPNKAVWYLFDINENDTLSNARILYNATKESKEGEKGLPDGLRVDKQGNIFATGPGGVWVFNKDGKVLGKFKTPVPTANCALADDDKTLYIAADMYVLRVKLRD